MTRPRTIRVGMSPTKSGFEMPVFRLPFFWQRRKRRARYLEAPAKASPVKAVLLFMLFLGASFFLAGCQSANITEVNIPYLTVRKIVVSNLPQGLREESLNGRELTSGFFSPHNWEEDATDKPERAFAKVLILNSGRPYDIKVTTDHEKRVKGTYEDLGEDPKLTKQLVDRIQSALADRRDDRNIIDDFRAF
jgi:hypothetical protein